jgi:hypothetical protein
MTMQSNVVKFPSKRGRSHPPMIGEKKASRPFCQTGRGSGVNISTLLFRSRELIAQSDEADLLRDVCRDPDKAQVKLKAIRRRLQGLQESTAR